MQIAKFELEIEVIDKPTSRRRRNGDPLASEEASQALFDAVDAASDALREHGFYVIRTSYGVTAFES